MARRVFFSFHYQDVIDFRANVVRNHNVTKDNNGGYFDSSLWESAKKHGDMAIKRLINSGLENTSVTVALIGSETYARRWVRYEIFKSIERGNDIFGIYINNIKCRNGYTKLNGPNLFDFIGLEISSNGMQARPTEWDGYKWIYSKDAEAFNVNLADSNLWSKNTQLSHWIRVKDWVSDDGFNNFKNWVG